MTTHGQKVISTARTNFENTQFRDVLGRYSEMGFTDLVVHWPRSDEPFRNDRAVLEQVAAELLTMS